MKINKEDKWVLVSCLQKSIRKGFKELTENYAEKLYELERSYLLYRLSIIAVEDVGLGNIDLVHDFLSTEIRKAKIEERGGKDYVIQIASQLSQSVKDRSACDLVSLACFHKEDPSSQNNLEKIFLNSDEPIVNRIQASWETLGAKKFSNPLVSTQDQDDIEEFLELNRRLVKDKKVLEVIKHAHQIHREPHFIALGLLSHLYESEKGIKIGKYTTGEHVDKQYPIKLVQNKWLIDGVDWHTKEGKAAIYEFIKEDTEIIKYLRSMVIDRESIAALIGMLLFRQSGHNVDKRLLYPSAVSILKTTQQLTFQQMTGNNSADFSKALKLMELSVPLLNEKIEKQYLVANPNHFPF